MNSCPGQPEYAGIKIVKLIWILMKQQVMGWQWHQLNRMQIICTSLQTDNHAISSPLSFLLFPTPNQQCPTTAGSLDQRETPDKSVLKAERKRPSSVVGR